MVRQWKNWRIEKILISFLFVWLGMEKRDMEKVSLYKFTHIPLLKKWYPIKTQKVINNQKIKNKKNQSPKFIKKKNHVHKKKITSKHQKKKTQKKKEKKNTRQACPINQKKRKKKKKKKKEAALLA